MMSAWSWYLLWYCDLQSSTTFSAWFLRAYFRSDMHFAISCAQVLKDGFNLHTGVHYKPAKSVMYTRVGLIQWFQVISSTIYKSNLFIWFTDFYKLSCFCICYGRHVNNSTWIFLLWMSVTYSHIQLLRWWLCLRYMRHNFLDIHRLLVLLYQQL